MELVEVARASAVIKMVSSGCQSPRTFRSYGNEATSQDEYAWDANNPGPLHQVTNTSNLPSFGDYGLLAGSFTNESSALDKISQVDIDAADRQNPNMLTSANAPTEIQDQREQAVQTQMLQQAQDDGNQFGTEMYTKEQSFK